MEGDARSRIRGSSNNNAPVKNGLAALVMLLCSGIISECKAWDCAATDRQTFLDFKQDSWTGTECSQRGTPPPTAARGAV